MHISSPLNPTGLTLALTLLLLFPTALTMPHIPSLSHRQLGSCALTPCAVGLCCSFYDYCGTGKDYCQEGACTGGVGGTCDGGLCCSEYGFCGTGPTYCTASAQPPATPTKTASSPPFSSAPAPTGTGTVNQWNQCGGEGWGGGTVCVVPFVCTVYSVWYSYCK